MAMDPTLKQNLYNNSAYGNNMSDKQSAYANSDYAQRKAIMEGYSSSSKGVTKPTAYHLANGKVLMRYPTSNRIDFKSLFGSIGSNDDYSDNDDTLTLIKKMQSTSNAILDAYTKKAKQNLGLS
jgi:hypothetical protein